MIYENATVGEPTSDSLAGVLPLVLGILLLLACIGGVGFLVSERFAKVGRVAAFISRQVHNALYGLVPVAALGAVGGIIYGASQVPGDAQEEIGIGAVVVVGAFVVLAAAGAGFKRFLARVRAVHPEWWQRQEKEAE